MLHPAICKVSLLIFLLFLCLRTALLQVKAKYTLYLNDFPEISAQSKKIDSSKGPLGDAFVKANGACVETMSEELEPDLY